MNDPTPILQEIDQLYMLIADCEKVIFKNKEEIGKLEQSTEKAAKRKVRMNDNLSLYLAKVSAASQRLSPASEIKNDYVQGIKSIVRGTSANRVMGSLDKAMRDMKKAIEKLEYENEDLLRRKMEYLQDISRLRQQLKDM